jgi:hypothetical protein
MSTVCVIWDHFTHLFIHYPVELNKTTVAYNPAIIKLKLVWRDLLGYFGAFLFLLFFSKGTEEFSYLILLFFRQLQFNVLLIKQFLLCI